MAGDVKERDWSATIFRWWGGIHTEFVSEASSALPEGCRFTTLRGSEQLSGRRRQTDAPRKKTDEPCVFKNNTDRKS